MSDCKYAEHCIGICDYCDENPDRITKDNGESSSYLIKEVLLHDWFKKGDDDGIHDN